MFRSALMAKNEKGARATAGLGMDETFLTLSHCSRISTLAEIEGPLKPPFPPLSNAPSSSFPRPFRDSRPSAPRYTSQRRTRRPLHCARTSSYPPPFEVSSLTSGDYSHPERINSALVTRNLPFFFMIAFSNLRFDRGICEQNIINCRCSSSALCVQRQRNGQ